MKIYSNKIRCKHCGDIIESKHVHDFKYCSCQSCAVDGGLQCLRRIHKGKPEECYEELSEYEEEEDRMGDLISRKAAIEAIDKERGKRHCFDTFEDGISTARGIVNTLPSTESSVGDSWIPIEKKFPQPYENVMISYDTGYGGCVDIGHIINNGNWRVRDNYRLISMNSVNAWMPLPQEYIWLSDADKKKETE